MFPESHFNLGLGAWITCIGQLIGHVEAHDRSMKFPYKVSKHTVGGRSVLYLKNKQTEWTKALRYALTDLKWLQEWAAKRIA
jgi:beclin